MIQNLKLFLLIGCCYVVNISCERTLLKMFKMTTTDMIREEGYSAEEHTITTEDGFVLTMHRIPGKSGSPAVLLQHGMLSSSFDWVVAGKNASLAFILADRGYDVWLGNARGNTYSRRHVHFDPSNPCFWEFSFHEMGIYDLPAVITYIADLKNDTLFYIGHSMGTTMSYIMAIERPDIAAKLKVILSLAPAAFVKYWTSPFRFFAFKLPIDFESLFRELQTYELLPQNSLTRFVTKYYCSEESEGNLCQQVYSIIFGHNPAQLNYKILRMIFSHTPAGTSVKVFLHYMQLARAAGKFRQYDYKATVNKIKYNSTEPPEYDVSKIKVPVGLFWSDNDLLIHPKDVEILYDKIPHKVLSYRVPDPLFTHLDFMWAKNAPDVLYPKLLSVMEDYL